MTDEPRDTFEEEEREEDDEDVDAHIWLKKHAGERRRGPHRPVQDQVAGSNSGD